MKRLLDLITPDDWKKGIALIILWAYGYQLVIWAPAFWIMSMLTAFTGQQWPAPPIVPWEQLFAGTATLATVGGIETWRESVRKTEPAEGGGKVELS